MLDILFPYHFVLDSSLKVIQKGNSLTKILPKKNNFEELFILKSPSFSLEKSFAGILSHLDQLFIIEPVGCDFLLQGQFVYNPKLELIFFCGNPWFKTETNRKKLNTWIEEFSAESDDIEISNFISTSKEDLFSKLDVSEPYTNQRYFFEQLFDEIPVDMAIIDFERRFRYLNKTSIRDDNLRKWIIGKTNTDYFAYKNYDKHLGVKREEIIQKAIDTNQTVWFEDLHNKNTDKEVVILRSVSPFTMHDNNKYLLGYGLDITEVVKNAKLKEQKNLILERLNKELNSIIYAITHDFRSPILAVKALVELLKTSAELNPEKINFMELITNSIQKIDNQIIEIYQYVSNYEKDIELSQVNLKEIVYEIFEMVKHIVPYTINLKLNVVENAIFYTDKYRLKIILNNLISNAVKYSSNRDRNSLVEFFAKIDRKTCNFYVKDNGEGIAEHLQKKVFNIYFRANHIKSGTGLGLYISNEAAKKLRGKIELESVVGKGSTFSVFLPNSGEDE